MLDLQTHSFISSKFLLLSFLALLSFFLLLFLQAPSRNLNLIPDAIPPEAIPTSNLSSESNKTTDLQNDSQATIPDAPSNDSHSSWIERIEQDAPNNDAEAIDEAPETTDLQNDSQEPENVAVSYESGNEECDLYDGSWVKDESYPLYESSSCPYVDEAFECQGNGRTDTEYLKWRWKPKGCELPRFNATDFLNRLRGKRLMLVGDSMNRNQFESLLCMLREGLSNKSKMFEVHGRKITKGKGYYVFKIPEYRCSVEFVRSHFLVKEGTRVNAQGSRSPTLSLDEIERSSYKWKRADILIFNTGHWWTHGKTARGKNYYMEGNNLYPQLDSLEAYKRALTTWARWVGQNSNSSTKLIIYRGYSSPHFRGGDWDSGGTCYGESMPISGGASLETYPDKMKVVEEVIKKEKVRVRLLNITKLTNGRKDGHPSVYGKVGTLSHRRQDCSHWCLPGVPDTWNELVYATLGLHQSKVRKPPYY